MLLESTGSPPPVFSNGGFLLIHPHVRAPAAGWAFSHIFSVGWLFSMKLFFRGVHFFLFFVYSVSDVPLFGRVEIRCFLSNFFGTAFLDLTSSHFLFRGVPLRLDVTWFFSSSPPVFFFFFLRQGRLYRSLRSWPARTVAGPFAPSLDLPNCVSSIVVFFSLFPLP